MTKLTPAGLSLVALLAGCSADGINPSGSGSLPVEFSGIAEVNCLRFTLDLYDENNVGISLGLANTSWDSEFLSNAGSYNQGNGIVTLGDLSVLDEQTPDQTAESNQEKYDSQYKGEWQIASDWRFDPGSIVIGEEDYYSNLWFGTTEFGEIVDVVMSEFNLYTIYPVAGSVEDTRGRSSQIPYLVMLLDNPVPIETCRPQVLKPIYDFICREYDPTSESETCQVVQGGDTPDTFWAPE